MHFPANVEESPLQTDAETGGEPGQDLLGRRPGGSQHCCASARRWGNTCPCEQWLEQIFSAVHALSSALGTSALPARILVPLSLASIGTHVSLWLGPRQVCAHVYKLPGGETGLIPSCHMQGIGLWPGAPITLILACMMLASHILKLPRFFQKPGDGSESFERREQTPALLSAPAGLRGCESVQKLGRGLNLQKHPMGSAWL